MRVNPVPAGRRVGKAIGSLNLRLLRRVNPVPARRRVGKAIGSCVDIEFHKKETPGGLFSGSHLDGLDL